MPCSLALPFEALKVSQVRELDCLLAEQSDSELAEILNALFLRPHLETGM